MKKWMALLSGLAIFLALVWWMSRNGEPVEVSVPVAEPTQPPRPPAPPPRDEMLGAPPPVVEETAVVPPIETDAPLPTAPSPPPRSTPRPPKNPVDPETAAREKALLDRVRQEVKSDPELALKSLKKYRTTFPDSDFSRDVELMRIESYLRLGKPEEADAFSRKLIGRDPAAKKAVERMLNDVRQN